MSEQARHSTALPKFLGIEEAKRVGIPLRERRIIWRTKSVKRICS